MKRFAVFCLVCAGCGAHARHDLGVRQVVTVSRDSGQVQFYGTHLFMMPPKGFLFYPKSDVWARDPDTYMTAEEVRHSYNDLSYEMKIEYNGSIRQWGFRVYYSHDFTFQNDSANITYAGGGTVAGQPIERMWMIFGSDSGSAKIYGQFKVGHNEDRAAILRAMLSCYKDTLAPVPLSEIQLFDVNMLQTGFAFNLQSYESFHYTIGGKGDPTRGGNDMITIWQIPRHRNDETLQVQFHSLVERFSTGSLHSETLDQKQVRIGGEDGYDATITGTLGGKALTYYLVMLQNERETIGFSGSAFDNQELRLQQYQQIARTLRLK
ncbi:MAG TPA: hypothetical protein VL547_21260 [Dinghuibacter sp.]|jgi:hypothetical protein|uniref:hypothetical protein n=1 Tax=Dinghuibacter sp. TaxID=2024697 RepID=UPI002CBEEE21|nr:hypothetical protein [Dinghuibacter sp.]HTJ14588.1 hypothetical protein [Dinghuibacter sp.]